jgi:hypothetical protein
MDSKDFAKFVANQQETVDEPRVDWTEVRHEWLGELDSLHQRVVDYLQDYIKAGSISYSFTEVTLTEENIGSYLAKRMDIKIGRQLVHLEPIGTLLIGSKGRVDAVGSAGRAQILLLNEKAKSTADLIRVTVTEGVKGNLPPRPSPPKQPISWAWKIVTNTSPKKFVDLDKEPFLELLMEIANA